MEPLADDEVHVHAAEAFSVTSADRAVLSEEERDRTIRFYFERDRILFIAAHAALRRVLAAHLDENPAGLRFETDKRGRPHVVGKEGLHFSLSHSGDRALVAVARTPTVGVDVEVYRDGIDFERLAERNYTEAEREELAGLAGDELRLAFYRVWTRKEAYVKALGKGLYHPLADFDVSAGEQARFHAFRDGSSLDSWSLVDLALNGQRVGALAVKMNAPRLRRTGSA